MNIHKIFLWLIAIVILAWVNYNIYQKEMLAQNGEIVLLELAPIDPRSLIQGDYMILRYQLFEDQDTNDWPRQGKLVLKQDDEGVATFVRLYEEGSGLSEDEILLDYLKQGYQISIGAESFFFQEGQAEVYSDAHYAELRVTSSGEGILTGLRDVKLQTLEAEE